VLHAVCAGRQAAAGPRGVACARSAKSAIMVMVAAAAAHRIGDTAILNNFFFCFFVHILHNIHLSHTTKNKS